MKTVNAVVVPVFLCAMLASAGAILHSYASVHVSKAPQQENEQGLFHPIHDYSPAMSRYFQSKWYRVTMHEGWEYNVLCAHAMMRKDKTEFQALQEAHRRHLWVQRQLNARMLALQAAEERRTRRSINRCSQ